MATYPARYADLPLFQGLTEAEAESLLATAGEGSVPARTQVMTLGQPGGVIYVLLSGTVRVQVEQEDGHLVILGYLGAGDSVGEMGVIERSDRSATVITTERCSYLWLDAHAFKRGLDTSPRLALNMMRVLSRRLRQSNDLVQSLGRRDVQGRVAHQLIALADAFGSPTERGTVIDLRVTQGELAALVGASREHVNRVLGDLDKAGLVSADSRHRFTIHDREGLAHRYV